MSLLDCSRHQSVSLDSVTRGSQGARKSKASRAAGGSQRGPRGCLRRPCPVPLPVCAGVDTRPVWPRQPDSQLTVLPGSKSHRGTEQQPPHHAGGQGGGTGLLAQQPRSRAEGLSPPEPQGHGHDHNNPAAVLTTQPQQHNGSHAVTTMPAAERQPHSDHRKSSINIKQGKSGLLPDPRPGLSSGSGATGGDSPLTLADDILLVKEAQLFPAMQINQSIKTQEGTDTGQRAR